MKAAEYQPHCTRRAPSPQHGLCWYGTSWSLKNDPWCHPTLSRCSTAARISSDAFISNQLSQRDLPLRAERTPRVPRWVRLGLFRGQWCQARCGTCDRPVSGRSSRSARPGAALRGHSAPRRPPTRPLESVSKYSLVTLLAELLQALSGDHASDLVQQPEQRLLCLLGLGPVSYTHLT